MLYKWKRSRQILPPKNQINALRHLKPIFDILFGQGDNKYDDGPDFIEDLRICSECRSFAALNRVITAYQEAKESFDELGEDIDKIAKANYANFFKERDSKKSNKYVNAPREKDHPKI